MHISKSIFNKITFSSHQLELFSPTCRPLCSHSKERERDFFCGASRYFKNTRSPRSYFSQFLGNCPCWRFVIRRTVNIQVEFQLMRTNFHINSFRITGTNTLALRGLSKGHRRHSTLAFAHNNPNRHRLRIISSLNKALIIALNQFRSCRNIQTLV